jgi:hypothetical protein
MKSFAMVLLLLAPIAHGGDDPFIGTWMMDIGASRYSSSEQPRKMVIVMGESADGVQYRSVSVQRDGRTITTEYVADYLGHLAMVLGNAGMMAPVSVTRIDSCTVEASYMRGFKAVAVSRRVLSRNGLVMTITTTSRSESGGQLVNVGVYLKAKSAKEELPSSKFGAQGLAVAESKTECPRPNEPSDTHGAQDQNAIERLVDTRIDR